MNARHILSMVCSESRVVIIVEFPSQNARPSKPSTLFGVLLEFLDVSLVVLQELHERSYCWRRYVIASQRPERTVENAAKVRRRSESYFSLSAIGVVWPSSSGSNYEMPRLVQLSTQKWLELQRHESEMAGSAAIICKRPCPKSISTKGGWI